MAGIPFELLEKLATLNATQHARETVAAERVFSQSKLDVGRLLASRRHDLSKEQFRAWRKVVRSGVMPPAIDPPSNTFAACRQNAVKFASAEAILGRSLNRELNAARLSLMESARRFLPSYLIFAAPRLRQLPLGAAGQPLPARRKSLRARERHLLLYLQRVCGKNDTLSEFGPESWGATDPATASLKLDPRPGITHREIFLERWTAHGAAAAINADRQIRVELAPRVQPNGRIERNEFVFTDSGERFPLDPETLALLDRCDGTIPAHSLGTNLETLERLAQQDFILWEMEVPALEAHAFDVLLNDISLWRAGPARTRWLEQLQPLAALAAKFARVVEPLSRLSLIEEATERLEKLGAHKAATRFLYSATNPIGEECFRECNFSISESLINEVAIEAAPWIDLWRDNYAFVASRVAAGLRGLLEQAPLLDDAIPLPAFLRHCAQMQMPLTGLGLIALAHNAFREVKSAFREQLHLHADQPEYELTVDDCQFVRREFIYDRFDEYTYPSADLQLGASSVEAVARGEYQWVLAELHPPVALLHHGFYWSCPDKEALSVALRSAACGQPNFHFGYFAADFTATTAVRIFDGLPDLTYFVAPQRGRPEWHVISPAESEVFVNQANGDVGLRRRGSREYLGSFARAWTIPLGFHPFSFSLGRHTPRLLCGNVVVQRRSWTVTVEELGAGDFTGISRDLVVAVERLRAARELPRHVYIRPTEQALRRSGIEGRDKDTKPVFIDLESYLFLEILHRWLTKAGELEVTEMLPTPDQLLWHEADGRRTFELRTLILPR
jgi:hypothetical protein